MAQARRFVTARLAASGLEELSEAAALVTTELVTNVLVHTRSSPMLRMLITADSVRIEVEDECPVLPVPGILDPTGGCGRGLVLVEQFTQRWGANRLPDTGKIVWFELVAGVAAPAEDLSADQLLDMWGEEESVAPVLAADGDVLEVALPELVRHVRVGQVSTALLNGAKTHLDDLIRDLTLLNEAASANGSGDEELIQLAARLTHLAADLIGFRNQIRRQAVHAVQRGVATLILELDVPVSLSGRLVDYQRALDDAEQHCVAGRLLVCPVPPEQTQFRRWKLNRIIEQLGTPALPPAAPESM
ncbi:MAG: ATP-binding protein [Actinomycetota bacterium]|nr:ATP-binding protein [Actinomycetota bacterium]